MNNNQEQQVEEPILATPPAKQEVSQVQVSRDLLQASFQQQMGRALIQYLSAHRDSLLRKVEKEDAVQTIYRLQGSLMTLTTLVSEIAGMLK